MFSLMIWFGISRLYCYAQKHVKSIRAVTKLPDTSMAKSFRAKSTRNKPPKPQTKTKPTSPYHVSDHKAAITVGVIMGVFLICWVPFFCVNIVASYCKTCISVRAFQVWICLFLFSQDIVSKENRYTQNRTRMDFWIIILKKWISAFSAISH